MRHPKTNYVYRVMLCIIIFFIAILSAYPEIDKSLNYIINYSNQFDEFCHICMIIFIPIYLALIIFGFGVISVYFATKIDRFFD